MKYLIALSALLLVGCGSRTQINPGAPRAVYIGSTQHMAGKIPAGVYKGHAYVSGSHSRIDGSITVNEQLHEWRLVEVWTHELVRHAVTKWLKDHNGKWDPDAFLKQYEGRGLNFNLYPEPW